MKTFVLSVLLILPFSLLYGQSFQFSKKTFLSQKLDKQFVSKSFSYRGQELPDSMMTFVWDGSSWDTSSIEIFQYDANENIILHITKYYDSTSGKFINSNKLERIYNNDKKLLSQVNYIWDNVQWLPSDRERHSYINGFEQSAIFEYYDGNNWVFVWGDSTEYTFNQDNLPITIINYYYYESTGSWTPSQKMELTYGTDNKPSMIVVYEWDQYWKQQIRVNNLKWDLGFNLENVGPTTYVMQMFMLNKWVNYEKYVAQVSSGHKTIDSFYTWNTGLQKWVDSIYSTYTYENNLMTEHFTWQYKWDKKMWDTLEIEVHAYDNYGNEVFTQSGSKWGDWFEFFNSEKITYVYGISGQIREKIYEYFDFYLNEWLKNVKYKYYYKSMSGINSVTSAVFRLFPNPATNILYINSDNLDNSWFIFGMKGELLLNGRSSDPFLRIDISGLPEGIYLIKIMDNTGRAHFERFLKTN